MDSKSWQKTLAESLIKNPRASFSIGAVLVIIFLAGGVLGLISFIRSQNDTTLNNNTAEIVELKAKIITLEFKNDSLFNLVGNLRSDVSNAKSEGLRKEVELKDMHNATLTALNGKQSEQIAAMERELKLLRASSVKTKRLSETVKTIQTQ